MWFYEILTSLTALPVLGTDVEITVVFLNFEIGFPLHLEAIKGTNKAFYGNLPVCVPGGNCSIGGTLPICWQFQEQT